MLIAQITDTHIRPKGKLLHHMIHTARSLRRCVERLEALEPRPDVVIATGDLVDRGKTKEYRRLRKMLDRLTIPLFVIPGNHDDRDALRDAFHDHAYLPRHGPLQYAINALPMRLIGLDSTRAHRKPGGELDRERLDWFGAALAAEPKRPTFVFLHHPPFEIGVAPVDAHRFRHARRFRAIVERNPQVVGIACGHIHRFFSTRIGNARAMSSPSTAPQLVVRTAAFGYKVGLEAPSFTLHHWDGRALRTSVHAVLRSETGDDGLGDAFGLVGIADLDAHRAG
ncbi:MAG: phosphodiesterase [Candidatus Lustribacter sp.]